MSARLAAGAVLVLLLIMPYGALAGERDEYYLRQSLIFFESEGPPRVMADGVWFTRGCLTDSEAAPDPYRAKILRRGTKVRVVRGQVSDEVEHVTLVGGGKHEIVLAGRDRTALKRAFRLLFSGKPVEDHLRTRLKTRKDVIKDFGYPIHRFCQGDTEKWFYIVEFAPGLGGYDGWTVTLKNDQVVEISGYI